LKNSMCPVIEGAVHFTLLFDGHANTHHLLSLLPCCVHATAPWSKRLIGQARLDERWPNKRVNKKTVAQPSTHSKLVVRWSKSPSWSFCGRELRLL